MRRLLALLAVCLAASLPAAAQDAATLVADRVEIRADRVLVAEGGVEVFFRGARLTARRIAYDGAADRLVIEGPITLTDGGDVALFAEQAELSADLQDGILTSARLVLAEQMQLAAVEIARVEGRYTELGKVVASSCQVCPGQPVPLWSIRARRVIHDQVERQIYFEDAQLRIGRIPVFWIPRLRFPDPTLRRSSGFLFPRVRSTSELGTGLKVPYFLTLGRSADLTLTPYLSPETRTLELNYRQAFRRGGVIFEGAVSKDEILPDDLRYYLFGQGLFALPRGFRLGFNLETVSDDAYLLDYGYSGKDRLQSSVALTRTRRDEHLTAQLLYFRSLREGEANSTQPSIVASGIYERRFFPAAVGGVATLGIDSLTGYRSSTLDGIGRDTSRTTLTLGWERSEVLGPGLVATALGRVSAEAYAVADDAAFDPMLTRLVPEAALTLRWPLARSGPGGAIHRLEPLAVLAWSPSGADPVPNEDSLLVELDEANLLALGRFPGLDAREEGLRLALGVGWTRIGPSGTTFGLTFGRIFRDVETAQFGPGTGLSGQSSDWLAVATLDLPGRVGLTARALLDNGLSVSKADLRLGYTDVRFNAATGLVLLAPSPEEGRPERIAEWSIDAAWRINPSWTGRAAWRYDFEADRATSAGLGFGWENECARVDLSLSRRFTSSTSVRPTTDFGLSVALTGFGTGGEGGAPRRRCVN